MKSETNDPDNWIPKDVFLSYCGDKTEKIGNFYDRAVARKQINSPGLNWLSILILPAWLGYRRQWSILSLVIGLLMFSSFVEAYFDFIIPHQGFTAAIVAIGIFGNSLLLQNANGKYQKLKKQGLSDEEISKNLANQARTSIPFAILGAVGGVVLIILSTAIADALFRYPM